MATDNSAPTTTPAVAIVQRIEIPPEQQTLVANIAATLDLSKGPLVITNFGNAQGRAISTAVDPVLNRVKTQNTGQVGQTLTQLSSTLTGYKGGLTPEAKQMFAGLPVVGKAFNKLQQYLAETEKIGRRIEAIKAQLDQQGRQISQDVTTLEALKHDVVANLQQLAIFVAAGRQKLAEWQAQLPTLQAAAKGDLLKANDATQLANAISRLDNKIHALDQLQTMGLQELAEIQLVQNTDLQLADSISTSVETVTSFWKQKVMVAVALYNQAQAAQSVKSVTDATNTLMQQVAEQLQTGTAMVQDAAARGVADDDTILNAIDSTIATINMSAQKQAESIRAHQDAAVKLADGRSRMLAAVAGLAQS